MGQISEAIYDETKRVFGKDGRLLFHTRNNGNARVLRVLKIQYQPIVL